MSELPANGGESKTAGVVLVVDDHELVCNLIVTLLESHGYDVMTASTGTDAIAMLSTHIDSIGCVIQDLSMPKMSGTEVIAELLKLRPGIPIIVLSADDEAYARPRLAGLDVAGYVQKPFDADELTAQVRAVIRPVAD